VKVPYPIEQRSNDTLDWESPENNVYQTPKVDYTTDVQYKYPSLLLQPPRNKEYPKFQTMEEMMTKWPQNAIDDPPPTFQEELQHFDYQNATQMKAAKQYRKLEFPFKIYNIPEIQNASQKWNDEYLTFHFDTLHTNQYVKTRISSSDYEVIPPSKGHAQQSVDHYFAFFNGKWEDSVLGDVPTVDNDFSYERFAKHANYADRVSLAEQEEHFYWQAGVLREERLQPFNKWSMISRDLPSFSSTTPTFFTFHPENQKGIQCRFGERGVTAATHYDGGMNMVAMIRGAKRYILSPPTSCGYFALQTQRGHPSFRHSMLNFGHISLLDTIMGDKIPLRTRQWLEFSKQAPVVDTVVKAGEVLYIPSFWFHYIVSLQKSAQCNTRSGTNVKGSPEFGGYDDVEMCLLEDDEKTFEEVSETDD